MTTSEHSERKQNLISRFAPLLGRGLTFRNNLIPIVMLFFLGTAIILSRIPGDAWDYIWAEDGELFLHYQLKNDSLQTMFQGYNGYQHLIPRIFTTILVHLVPLSAYAVAILITCAILIGLVMAATFWLARDLIPSASARFVLALVPALLPVVTIEVAGNLADFHQYCIWLMPLLLLTRHRGWLTAIAWALITFIVTMTELQIILFLALIPFLRWRDRKIWPTVLAYLIGLIWQFNTWLQYIRTGDGTHLSPSSLLKGWLINSVLPLVFTNPEFERSMLPHKYLVPMLILLPFILAFGYIMLRGTWTHRILASVLVIASWASYAGSALANAHSAIDYDNVAYPEGWSLIWVNLRYGVAGGMLLCALIPIAASLLLTRHAETPNHVTVSRRSRRKQHQSRHPAAQIVTRIIAGVSLSVTVIVFTIAGRFTPMDARMSSGITWSQSVTNAQASCNSDHAPTFVTLSISPRGRSFIVPCATILHYPSYFKN